MTTKPSTQHSMLFVHNRCSFLMTRRNHRQIHFLIVLSRMETTNFLIELLEGRKLWQALTGFPLKITVQVPQSPFLHLYLTPTPAASAIILMLCPRYALTFFPEGLNSTSTTSGSRLRPGFFAGPKLGSLAKAFLNMSPNPICNEIFGFLMGVRHETMNAATDTNVDKKATIAEIKFTVLIIDDFSGAVRV